MQNWTLMRSRRASRLSADVGAGARTWLSGTAASTPGLHASETPPLPDDGVNEKPSCNDPGLGANEHEVVAAASRG